MENVEFLKGLIAIGGIPIIVGIVQILKPLIKDHRFLPLIAVALGLGFNALITWAIFDLAKTEITVAIFNGIIAGLAASGAYATGKEIKGGSN